MKKLAEQMLRLASLPAVTGREEQAADFLVSQLEPYVDHVERDVLGNVIGRIKGCGEHPLRLMLDAHADHIGLMIRSIERNGVLRFTGMGGVNRLTLCGKRVKILGTGSGTAGGGTAGSRTAGGEPAGRGLPGIIGMTPPHLATGKDKNKVPPMHELYIDAGFSSREQAQELVSVGDVAYIDQPVRKLLSHHICGPGLDNRAGVMSVLHAAQLLGGRKPYHHLIFLFTVQEEVGLRGARTGAFGTEPDAAVACDVDFADPGAGSAGSRGSAGSTGGRQSTTGSPAFTETITTGAGPVVGFGPNFYPPLVRTIRTIAGREDIPLQNTVEARPGGTDATAIQVSRSGVYTAALYVPLRYMHSPAEIVSLKDLHRAAKILMYLACEPELFETDEGDEHET
jgi:endoglucanase